jgi:26 proteasome complex subunit DSS1
MADPAQTGQTLDEDDDFVEFEVDNWTEREANYNQQGLWDSTWDDVGDGNDAVAQQIRTELTKKQQAAANGQGKNS